MTDLDNVSTCGTLEIIVSILVVFFGAGCSIASKVMMSITCTDNEDGSPQERSFQKPLFVTFVLFFAMMLVLLLHWTVLIFELDFPGYSFDDSTQMREEEDGNDTENGRCETTLTPCVLGFFKFKPKSSNSVSTRKYFILAIPATLDLVSITMHTIGLQYLDVSIFTTLRGSQIIFVALLKQYVWKQQLLTFHWVGVYWNVVSAVLVGVAAVLTSEEGHKYVSQTETVFGVCLILSGAFAQALTVVTEEHIMKMDNPAPPLLLIGMKGKQNKF